MQYLVGVVENKVYFREKPVDASGRGLRALLKDGGFSVRGLAKELGVPQPYLHLVRHGKRPMSLELADLLLLRFRLCVGDLLEPEELGLCRCGGELAPVPEAPPIPGVAAAADPRRKPGSVSGLANDRTK